jgi:hypothetical protein
MAQPITWEVAENLRRWGERKVIVKAEDWYGA